jgi:hypothetical protein
VAAVVVALASASTWMVSVGGELVVGAQLANRIDANIANIARVLVHFIVLFSSI